jgi:hypothetical protein
MDSPPEDSYRSNLLIYLFTSLGLGFLALVAVALLGSIVIWVGGLLLLGIFHYFLWGRMLTKEVAGQREEEELLHRAEVEEPDYHRHFRE